jgi:heme/copper-type cytochrome/quinol oxidase subunit 1
MSMRGEPSSHILELLKERIMFSTVRYFIKTSLIFLFIGLFSGIYISVSKYFFHIGTPHSFITAHTHIILIGAVMMMIMGVALWFFPRPEKDDTKYKPGLILFTYWLLTISTSARFIFQISDGIIYNEITGYLISTASVLQVVAITTFFYSMWGRIRAVGSKIREERGERF